MDSLTLALSLEAPSDSDLALFVDAAKDKARPWELRLEAYQAVRKVAPEAQTSARIKILAAWLEQGAHAQVPQHVTDFVNETGRGSEIESLVNIGKTGIDSESCVAWQALITVLNSPLADAKAKSLVSQRLSEMPMEVGIFLAIAELQASGFDKQIDAGINSDNEKTILAAKAAKKAGAVSAVTGLKVAEMEPTEVTAFAMNNKGDVATGERLFVSQGCIACHAVDPAAVQKGPYFGSSGAKFHREYLIQSILAPSAVVAQGFQTVSFVMNDGASHLGFVTKEQDGIVEVRDITGQVHVIKRDNVKQEQILPQSMMPPGLGGSLSVKDFTSLIEYLTSLKSIGA